MSELTRCNYCSLQEYKRQAKEQNKEVKLVDAKGKLKGLEVYIVPKGEEPDTRQDSKGNHLSKQWVGWFMELTDHCVC